MAGQVTHPAREPELKKNKTCRKTSSAIVLSPTNTTFEEIPNQGYQQPVDPSFYEMSASAVFPLPHHHTMLNAFHQYSYQEVPEGNNVPQPSLQQPAYGSHPVNAMGLLTTTDHDGNCAGYVASPYLQQRISPQQLHHDTTPFDREERYIPSYGTFIPCDSSVVSSSPDTEQESLQQLHCHVLLPPRNDICDYATRVFPDVQDSNNVLYSGGHFSSHSDSVLSDSDVEAFHNGREESPKSSSSTPNHNLHHRRPHHTPQIQLPPSAHHHLGPDVRTSALPVTTASHSTNHYKSVITCQGSEDAVDEFGSSRAKIFCRSQTTCSEAFENVPLCYFDNASSARQVEVLVPNAKFSMQPDTGDSVASVDSYSASGPSTFRESQPQAGYTSVIVDAQQYHQITNGFVH